jgi:uncharacterized membrane protein YtjA (UPF0391 family)
LRFVPAASACAAVVRRLLGFCGWRAVKLHRSSEHLARATWRGSHNVAGGQVFAAQATTLLASLQGFKSNAIVLSGGSAIGLPSNYSIKRTAFRRRLFQALAMGTASEHWKRSQELADAARKLVISLNSGGIALLFSVAGWLAAKNVSATWAICPAVLFVVGLVLIGVSLFVAKDRELDRFHASRAGGDPKDIETPWYKASFTWDAIAFAFFVSGAVLALYNLAKVTPTYG